MMIRPPQLTPMNARIITIVSAILVFGSDWLTEPSINVSLLFGCVVVLLAWSDSFLWLWICTGLFGLLSLVALYAADHTAVDTTNRYITIGMLFIIAGFAHYSIVLDRGFLTEASQRKKAEDSLTELRSELSHVGRVSMMGELGSSIAHEITQPLSGIIMNGNAGLRWLSADPPNLKEAESAIRRIVRDGNLANGVIQRIRQLLQKTGVAKADLSMNDIIQEAINLARYELDRKEVVVREELGLNLPTVKGDRVQLEQVLLNLILNGVDSMSHTSGRKRELIIRTQKEKDGKVLVSVRDSGTGFGGADPDRFFDAFYTTKEQGMGMGLAISRSIIADHEGRLWATENEGPGATFLFEI
jgi:C4-dicarboxylate-specific signal transduction histidine kinase